MNDSLYIEPKYLMCPYSFLVDPIYKSRFNVVTPIVDFVSSAIRAASVEKSDALSNDRLDFFFICSIVLLEKTIFYFTSNQLSSNVFKKQNNLSSPIVE